MTVCKYWKRGNCREGSNCRYEHPANSGFNGGGNNNNNNNHRGPFGGGFGAINRPERWQLNEDDIKNDLTTTRPKWILSAYGPGKEPPASLFGDNEFSAEEIRWRFYDAQAKGNADHADQEAIQAWQKALNDMNNGAQNVKNVQEFMLQKEKEHPNRYDMCKMDGKIPAQDHAKNAQGNAVPGSSINPFGNPQHATATSNPFSKPAFGQSASPFGQAKPAPGFGQPAQPSAFGKPAFGQSASPFGQPAPSQPAFGQPAAPQPTFGTSPFGQPSAPAPSLFGKEAAGNPFSKPAASSGFGQPSALGAGNPSNAFGKPAAAGGFGQPAFGQTAAAGNTPSPFAASSGFGQAGASPSPFGQQQPTSSAFKQDDPPPAPSTSGFGQPAFGQSPFGQQATPAGPSPFSQPMQSGGASPFAQPAQSTTQSPFGQQQQPQAAQPSPFGAPQPPPTAGFGQPANPSPFGQQPQPQPQPQASQAANPTPSGAATPGAHTTSRTSLTDKPIQPLHYTQSLHGPPPQFDSARKPTTYKGLHVISEVKTRAAASGEQVFDQEKFMYERPDGRGKERIWFPHGNAEDAVQKLANALLDFQVEEALYTDDVKGQYRGLFETGRFEAGRVPLLPPVREWVGYDI